MDKETIETADEARQKAIDWQSWSSEQAMSWQEVAGWGNYFEELATRFPELREEFAENGIIGREEEEKKVDPARLTEVIGTLRALALFNEQEGRIEVADDLDYAADVLGGEIQL